VVLIVQRMLTSLIIAADTTQSITSEMQSVYDAIAACDTSEAAPVVLFISKMVPVKRGDIVDANGTSTVQFMLT
jgi:hypothetical protein